MNEMLNILVIEESPADFLLIERHLIQNGLSARCSRVARLDELKCAMDMCIWDAVLSDYGIPQLNFPDSLELLQSRLPEVPLILVSGSVGEEQAVELLKLGVWDFVLKDSLARLVPAIERSLRDAAVRRGRKVAEEALTKSEAGYRSLFDHMLEGFAHCRMVYDGDRPRDFIYLSVNKAFEALTGLKDVVGKKVSEVIPGILDSNRELLEIYGRVALTGRPERFETYVEPLGFWFSTSVYSTEKEYFIAVFDNITERKRAEEAREATIELLRICNEAGTLRDLMRNLTGYFQKTTGCEAVGVRLREGDDFPYYESRGFSEEFVLAENSLCAYDQTGELIRDYSGHPALDCMCGNILCGRFDTGKPFFTLHGSFWSSCTTELLANTTDADRQAKTRNRCNGEGYESVALIPIRLRGETLGLFQFNDRRAGCFSAEKITLLENLADYVSIALAKLKVDDAFKQLEAELRQAQKMEAIGQLAGGIAHDFNNMLSVILGFSQMGLMRLTPKDPLYRDLLQIEKAAQRSADLTRQLLAFSRKQVTAPAVINLNEVIEEQQKMLTRLIGEDISIDFKPADDLWNIRIDPSQVDQILTNLAVNARDAICGVGTVTIATANITLDRTSGQTILLPPGEYMVLTLSDTGAGMDAATLERIFEPFFTTKGEGKGTGLGLSTVYGIVRQNEGMVRVESEQGMGTTFRIYFPRIRAEKSEPVEAPRETPLAGSETVLIVEDEEQILTLARTVLEQHGYEVLTAATPDDACLMCEEYTGDIHLLLSDVVMPGMNGKELRASIEAVKPGIRTLFMSGYTSDIIANRGIIDQGVEFVPKPFTVESLARKVRAVLDA